jgi:hypothetical protein
MLNKTKNQSELPANLTEPELVARIQEFVHDHDLETASVEKAGGFVPEHPSVTTGRYVGHSLVNRIWGDAAIREFPVVAPGTENHDSIAA